MDPLRRIRRRLKRLSETQTIALAIATLLLVVLVPMGTNSLTKSTRKRNIAVAAVAKPTKSQPLQRTTVASRMTGVQVAPELNDLPVTGVMIENEPHARPQAGLAQADMVYEALVEGGITRFLALFQESRPDRIGPVRSVRPYYLDFSVPYDAAIAHSGGSAKALAQIRNEGIKAIFHGDNLSTFERTSERVAPHNLYTSRTKLLAAQSRGGYTISTYTGLARKRAETPIATPNAKAIDLRISSFLYNPHFDYDPAYNSYKRSEGGKPHSDERGLQISPKAVVALVTPHSYVGIYSQYGVNGRGAAYIFQDGTVVQGVWSKADRQSQLVLTDAAGAVLPLNPGQTWITLVASAAEVKIAP
jgi:hypothetical protein